MSLSRRHFEQIAFLLKRYNAKRQSIDVITRRGERMAHGNKQFDDFMRGIADYFASENAQFSYSRFHDAVYPNGLKYSDEYYDQYRRACEKDAEEEATVWKDVTL
tara:strand:+ start:252 stop:566 length:315 start_codon:yes stop_codon:yes gene_type:complete